MLYGQILDPFALAQHVGTQNTFNKIGVQTDGIQRQDGHICKAAQAEGQGDTDGPHKTAVEQECDKGLAARAEGKIGGVGVGIERHGAGADADEPGGQMSDAVAGIVDFGENTGETGHQTAEEQAGSDGQGQQFPVAVPDGFFRVAGTQHLSHNDADGVAHGQEYNTGKIEQGGADVHGGHHIQTAGGIALVQNGHTTGPEEFVAKKRHTLDGDGFEELSGDVCRAENPGNKGIFAFVQMGPAGNHSQFHEAGNNGGQSRAFHTHGRGSEMAENQNIIENKIHQNRGNSGNHRHHSLSGFPEGAGIGIGQGKGQETPDHDSKILQSVFHGTGSNGRIAFTGQIQTDQEIAAQPENQCAQKGNNQAD